MGRSKFSFKLIRDEKSRKSTFLKRRKGLKKKMNEFAILCGVEACLICFGPHEKTPETWPENPRATLSIVQRYKSVSQEEREKRRLDLSSFLEQGVRRLQQEFYQKKRENAEILYPSWIDQLNGFSKEKLRDLSVKLELKIEMVKQRVQMLKSMQICEGNKQEILPHADQQNQLNYLLGMERRDHGFPDYTHLPISSCIDLGCVSTYFLGPDNPSCSGYLPFSDIGFQKEMQLSHAEIDDSLIVPPLQTFGGPGCGVGPSCNAGTGLLESVVFWGKNDKHEGFQNKLVVSKGFDPDSCDVGFCQSRSNIRPTIYDSTPTLGFTDLQSHPSVFENLDWAGN